MALVCNNRTLSMKYPWALLNKRNPRSSLRYALRLLETTSKLLVTITILIDE
jgi:hypothetical protein